MKGRANEQGKFLKLSKILRNGKEYCVFIPGDIQCVGRLTKLLLFKAPSGLSGKRVE